MNVQRYGIAPDYVYGHDKFGQVTQSTEKPYYVLESAFDRVTAERDALQLRLNAVEEENDRLRNLFTAYMDAEAEKVVKLRADLGSKP